MRARRRLRAGLIPMVLAACTADATGPAGAGLEVAVSLAGGVTEAYAKTDQVAVRVTVGGVVVLEETQAVSPTTGDVTVQVQLDRAQAGAAIEVMITTFAAGAATFEGTGSGTIAESGPTRVEVGLDPIIARVAMDEPAATFTAIGETGTLSGAAVFATGDTIPDVAIVWSTLDPDIVEVSPDGTALAVSEGDARIRATAGEVTTPGTATVDPVAVLVTVTPRERTLAIGESATFTARLEDRNGNVLTRAPTWTSSDPAVATVTTGGVVLGIAAGRTTITAESDDASSSALVTVVAAPAAPGELSLTVVNLPQRIVLLEWQDNSANEDEFVVERQVDGGAYGVIANLPPNTTSYEAAGLPGTNRFRVVACNAEGCSASSNEVEVEFPSGPPVVETLPSPDIGIMAGSVVSGSAYQVSFQYGYQSNAFDPGCVGSSGGPCYESTLPATLDESGEFVAPAPVLGLGLPFLYRIVAENEFGAATGDVVTMDLPDIDYGATWEWETAFLVTAMVSVSGPSGVFESPIESVLFESAADGTQTPGTETVTDNPVSGIRTYTYTGSYEVMNTSEELDFVITRVLFTSGVEGVAFECVGFCSSGEVPPPAVTAVLRGLSGSVQAMRRHPEEGR